MRKKILLLASVAALAMISIIGCGSKSGTESTASAEIDYNVDDYVTLGDYKNLVVEYPGKFEVTDEEVEDEIKGFSIYIGRISTAIDYARISKYHRGTKCPIGPQGIKGVFTNDEVSNIMKLILHNIQTIIVEEGIDYAKEE